MTLKTIERNWTYHVINGGPKVLEKYLALPSAGLRISTEKTDYAGIIGPMSPDMDVTIQHLVDFMGETQITVDFITGARIP